MAVELPSGLPGRHVATRECTLPGNAFCCNAMSGSGCSVSHMIPLAALLSDHRGPRERDACGPGRSARAPCRAKAQVQDVVPSVPAAAVRGRGDSASPSPFTQPPLLLPHPLLPGAPCFSCPCAPHVLGSAFEDISRYRGGWGQRKVEVIRRGGPAAHPMRAPLPIFRSAPEAHPACTLHLDHPLLPPPGVRRRRTGGSSCGCGSAPHTSTHSCGH